MANKTVSMEYKYTVEMTYLDIDAGTSTEITNECIKSIIIDHKYEENCMPILYVTAKLGKSMVDNMIIHANTNLFILAIYKYDDLTEDKPQTLCFRKKFTYFLPNSVNATDAIDYTDDNYEETEGTTYSEAVMGLIAVEHIENNKKHCQITAKGNTNFDCVKYVTNHMSNILIEPFTYSETFDSLVMPPQDSVNKALHWLNDNRVFYNTPFRFYQDFNYSYIMSSSGRAVENRDEMYSSVLISIKEIDEGDANDVGVIADKTSQTYEIPVNYVNTQVYDNTIANKSRNIIRGITSSGVQSKTLKTSADYLGDKVQTIRLNNDNDNMMYNIEHKKNSEQILLYLSKTGLDIDCVTLNKRITVSFIPRYNQYNGVYILYRQRLCFIREDTDFVLVSMINLRKLEDEDSI